MRKFFVPLLLSAAACFAVVFAGCAGKTYKPEKITNMQYYAEMYAGGDKIDVCFDNGTKYGFNFTVEDKTVIEEIMNILLAAELTDCGNEPPAPLGNTHFTVYQGVKSYGISLSGIFLNGNRYEFSTRELRDKITAVAEAYGAFDTEVGVIYKVIALSDFANVKDEKITADGKDGLLDLIESGYGGCGYFFVCDGENSAEVYTSANGLTERDYADTVTAGKEKLFLICRIYQSFNSPSYYIKSTAAGEYADNGNTISMQFMFGLWHVYNLQISVIS